MTTTQLGVLRTLDALPFDNTALRALPIDPIRENYVRRAVEGACFSMVDPTPVENPVLVCYCPSALKLLDLDPNETNRADFAAYLSGNKKIPGTETAAHCYCGYQFGSFSGQLGDGRAIYLGEVVNSAGQRLELQLKGAGPTPYSRNADGRAVLRSSIREFLCSEALYYLGIPTTRAATVVTSDTMVERDLEYSGNPIQEKATVVLRLAPTFLRFGSFQIFLGEDETTGRSGPSEGRNDIKQALLNYTIKTHFPEIWALDMPVELRYAEFYKEVVRRTARLVAEWQCVGFAHGVLNTDSTIDFTSLLITFDIRDMSIVGLTIDYGPFGFMDYHDPDFICNGSDHEGVYAFTNQPLICKWNCEKLAEALDPLIPLDISTKILEAEFDSTYDKHFHDKMRKKLGLIDVEHPEDKALIDSLLTTMAATGSDFTNTFRSMTRIRVHNPVARSESQTAKAESELEDEALLAYLLTQGETQTELLKRKERKLLTLAQKNLYMLYTMGSSPEETLMQEIIARQEYQKLEDITDGMKAAADEEAWRTWISQYRTRVQLLTGLSQDHAKLNQDRMTNIKANSPKYVLRNYLAQNAIAKAETGDYSEVDTLLKRLHDPYLTDQYEQIDSAF